ncbi:26S proteasome subunit BLM10 [Acrasis kona]|uniref:26S proteasome subunit BLM10 n=1 Tax=Acrasis kona TaxID=1008807 RepID=A0AAW2ZJD4_9EUKA
MDQMDTGEDTVPNRFKYNEILPEFIRSGLVEESEQWKKQIFEGFEKVAAQEKKEWNILLSTIRSFQRYISTVHYPLTIEERERICNLLVPMLTNKDTSIDHQARIANVLNKVLKDKLDLNIQVDWRPIYDLIKRHYFRKNRTLLYMPIEQHRKAFLNIIYKLRKYFPAETATEEILSELRPMLCPHDFICGSVQSILCLLIPTKPPASNPSEGEPYWLGEVLSIWQWSSNNPFWDLNLISLLRRLSQDRMGNINWDPYLQLIFTRILRSLDLPIGNTPPPSSYNRVPGMNSTLFGEPNTFKTQLMEQSAQLCISLISPINDQPFILLSKLFKSIEQFYHPSNGGEWSDCLGSFLYDLSKRYARRLLQEQESNTNKPFHLNDETNRCMVGLLYPIAKMAMFSKSHRLSLCAIQSIKHLSYVLPEQVFPTLMESISHALQTLTETHQTSAAMELLSVVISPVLNKKDQSLNGSDYVADLMQLALPGIDTNDHLKTLTTSKFYTSLLSIMPLLTNSGEGAPVAVQYFEEWSIQFLSRAFQILHHLAPPSENKKKKGKAIMSMDIVPSFALTNATKVLFQQVDLPLHALLSKKVIQFVSSEFLPNATKQIGMLCRSAAMVESDATNPNYDPLDPFIQLFYKKLIKDHSNQESTLNHLTDNETNYYLRILGKTIQRNQHVHKHSKPLLTILNLISRSESDSTSKTSGKLLKNVLQSLTLVYPSEYRSVSPSVWNSKSFRNEHWNTWGRFTTIDQVDARWHVPSDSEMNSAVDIYNQFVIRPVDLLNQYVANPSSITKSQFTWSLVRIRSLLRGASLMLPELEKSIANQEFTKRHVRNEFNCGDVLVQDSSRFEMNRFDLGSLLHRTCGVVNKNGSDTKLLNLIIKTYHALICYRSESFQKMLDKQKQFAIFKRNMHKSYNKKQCYARQVMIQKAHCEFVSRIYMRVIPFADLHSEMISDLYDLSICEFSKVRLKAQNVFANVLKLFHGRLLPKFIRPAIRTLQDLNSTNEQINGAIYILHKSSILKRIMSDWQMLSEFMLAINKTHHIDKPTIQTRLNNLFVSASVHFKELKIESKSDETHYRNMVNGLLNLIKNPDLHWRYQLMVYTVLVLTIRSDHVVYFPIEGIKIFLKAITSDIISIRVGAIKAVNLILSQYKPNQPKRIVHYQDDFPFDFMQLSKSSHGDSIPKSKSEWERLEIHDKNWFGWNAKPKSCQVYDYSKSVTFSNHVQEMKIGTSSIVLQDAQWLNKLFELLSMQPRPNRYSFEETTAHLFKGMFQIYGPDLLNVTKCHLEKIISHAGSQKPEERSNIALASEFIGGFVRGSKHWAFEDRESAFDYMMPLLDKLLRECSLLCIPDLQAGLRFMIYDFDVRRIHRIRDLLIRNLNLNGGTTASQVKSLSYLLPAFNEISWRDLITQNHLVNDILIRQMSQPYQQVRDGIANCMMLPFRFGWVPARDATTQHLIMRQDESSVPQSHLNQIIRSINDQLVELKQSQISNADLNADSSGANSALVSFSRTLVTWLQHVIGGNSSSMSIAPYIDMMVPMLSSVYAVGNDSELQSACARAFVTISTSLFSKKSVHQIMSLAMQVESAMAKDTLNQSNAMNWRVRLMSLVFVQSFAFRHQFYLLNKQEEDLFYVQLMTLLKDKSVEVREQACSTLAGFIKIANDEKVQQLVEHFESASINPAKKKKKANSSVQLPPSMSLPPKFDAHYAVLGLSALIRAYPYDVPSFLPRLMVRLADFQHYKTVKIENKDEVAVSAQVINDTVRKTFSNFWRTHRDTWHIHKSKFEEDQLYVVTQLLVSPVYYA